MPKGLAARCASFNDVSAWTAICGCECANKKGAEQLRALGFPRCPEGQMRRSTIIFFTSAMALAGFKLFGHAWAQFMMVWQR